MLREEESSSLVRKVVDTSHPSLEPAAVTPEALQRAQRNLATAYEVSGLIVRAADMRSLLQSIIDAIFQSLAADRAALLLQRSRRATAPTAFASWRRGRGGRTRSRRRASPSVEPWFATCSRTTPRS